MASTARLGRVRRLQSSLPVPGGGYFPGDKVLTLGWSLGGL